VDVEPDPIVEALVPPSGQGDPPDVVALIGFVGQSPGGGPRLFKDPHLKVYMDLLPNEVVHQHKIPAEQDEFGGRSVLWVDSESLSAPLLTDLTERLQAEFLVGPIAARALMPQTRGEVADRLTFIALPSVERRITTPYITYGHCCA
jgi:hypothetical protein